MFRLSADRGFMESRISVMHRVQGYYALLHPMSLAWRAVLHEIESVIYPTLKKLYEKFEKLKIGKLRSKHDRYNKERKAQKKAA